MEKQVTMPSNLCEGCKKFGRLMCINCITVKDGKIVATKKES